MDTKEGLLDILAAQNPNSAVVGEVASYATGVAGAARAIGKKGLKEGLELIATQSHRVWGRMDSFTGPLGIKYKVFQRQIDPDLVFDGMTNLERMKKGGSPYVRVGDRIEQVELHHSRQNANGPLFELNARTHGRTPAGQGKEALHPYGKEKHPDFPVDRGGFERDRRAYWRSRARGF